MIPELPIEQYSRICDPNNVGCETSAELSTTKSIIGQERAVAALQFGLGIKERGFNIYVAGQPGTGRTTAIKRFLEEAAQSELRPSDWCYVNNFQDGYHPTVLRLPQGRAKGFQRDVEDLIKSSIADMRSAFEGEEYSTHREETISGLQAQKQELFEQLGEEARQEGFLIQPTPMGLVTIPVRKGKPLSNEEFLALSAKEREDISQKQDKLQEALQAAIRQSKVLDKNILEALVKLDREVALYAFSHHFDELREKYQDLEDVLKFLEQIQNDILDNLSELKADSDEQEVVKPPGLDHRQAQLRNYKVNVLVDNSGLDGAPVVLERNPTYNNLFGRIEHEAQFGALLTDFTLIRRGTLHEANGGYLVLPVEELLRNPLAWDSLKRALEDKEIIIEDIGEKIGLITTKSLRPDPIPLDVKVILVGRPDVYQLLYAYDEQFIELFKVKADFDSRMARTEENIGNYAAFVSTVCETEKLKHVDSQAIARIVEHGSRLAEDQEKLSTKFGEISDVIREASYYAGLDGSQYISAAHVQKAIDERFHRSSLIQERIQEMIERDMIKIVVSGEEVGQVNGLSVIELGDIAFGQPSRITATIGIGREGLIDIEKEADLSGPIHTKGVLILSGYLTGKYAQDKPISLSARLVFEQNYSGIEGDSASSTELYAIISALSGLKIKQGIAVTGSVNQKGEIQAIGGVNEKIEGFFEICRAKGLTGTQGVIIPASNAANLMLKESVLQAARDGKFHIWAVRSIDEGIEILTGVESGLPKEDGTYAEGTVNYLVNKRLNELAETLSEFEQDQPQNGKAKSSVSRK